MPYNKNAFDALRVLLCLFVFLSHGYLLAGIEDAEPLKVFSKGQVNLGNIGVAAFFALSGFLITSSFTRTANPLRFLYNRALRIFPGFWVCLLVTAFVIAPVMHYLNTGALAKFNFWQPGGAYSFVKNNALLSIGQWGINDVTAKSYYQGSTNGSLWSLYPEMLCYIMTCIAGLFGLFNKNKAAFLIILVFTYVVYVVNIYDDSHKIGPAILTLSNARLLYTSYLSGMALYLFQDDFVLNIKGLIFLLLLSLLLIRNGGFDIAAPAVIAIVAVKGFSTFTLNLKYDISYGLYIYAFPVQQLMLTNFVKTLGFTGAMATALVLTCILAFISFVLIERPFLRLKRVGIKP